MRPLSPKTEHTIKGKKLGVIGWKGRKKKEMELPLKEEAEGEREDPGGPEERDQGGLVGGFNLGIERGKTLMEMMITQGQRGQMQALERVGGHRPHAP